MKKALIPGITLIILLMGAYVWFGLLGKENPLPGIIEEPQEIRGEITSFYVAKPNLVIETVGLETVRIHITPADRQLEDVLWGEATLVEEFGQRKTWTLPIPEEQLVRKVYAIGEDEQGLTTERTVFPIAGIVEIFEALWVEAPATIVTLGVGEEVVVDQTVLTVSQVLEDSRCPTTKQCVQAGRLVLELLVGDEGRFVVSSTDEELHVGDLFIKIVQVFPHAQEDNVPEEEYQMTLSIVSDVHTYNDNS